MVQQIFINLAVKDLDKTKAFFSHLGFTFNPQFTNEFGACMIIGKDIFAMLLTEQFFNTFHSKTLCDPSSHTEVINAFQVESRAEVDEMLAKALEAGAVEHRPPQEYEFMYGRSFQDIDGHLWEVGYIEPIIR